MEEAKPGGEADLTVGETAETALPGVMLEVTSKHSAAVKAANRISASDLSRQISQTSREVKMAIRAEAYEEVIELLCAEFDVLSFLPLPLACHIQ